MEWHSGKTLSQTIFTDLFVHFVGDLDPDMAITPELDLIPERPLELLTTVIGASTLGLMKCCDLSWRLLSNGLVEDVCRLTLVSRDILAEWLSLG
jgi:N-alpha-acetyltransferase 35, NatC auxiliary subunit